jgi:putative Holliday junction resolvase
MNIKEECIIGIDFGLKRIGLAICRKGVTIALQTKAIESKKSDSQTITAILETFPEKIDRFILGLPFYLDGKESLMTLRVREFGKILEEQTKKPVHYIDETLTSEESETLLKDMGLSRKERIPHKDSLSAYLILNDFLVEKSSLN